jgi:4-alpha-glucanotransferase
LAPPTALPAFAREGVFAGEAERFIALLADAGFSVWQMLPVHPPDATGSPYHACSVHAGDARLVVGGFEPAGIHAAIERLRHTFERGANVERRKARAAFEAAHAHWLDDYSRFRVLQARHPGSPWWRWPAPVRRRDPAALAALDREAAAALAHYRFEQFAFFERWGKMRRAAAARGVLLLGDLPILCAQDSVEVWSHPEYFLLDDAFQPTEVAGVPPDYFSATGQRWGNPLYDWARLAADGFRWWIDRVRTELALFDCVRLDHFRGFEALWHIPAASATAVDGRWRPVPGRALFAAIKQAVGALPFVAEDLGTITPEVDRLRLELGLPGMLVLQFAFDSDAANPYLPHNHVAHALVCTGTHDNETALAWFEGLAADRRKRVLEYLGEPVEPMPAPLVRAALGSVARLAMLPLQDLLALGAGHRINTPSTAAGNWRWRFGWDWIPPGWAVQMRALNALYGRV